jgi:hypothetical protein
VHKNSTNIFSLQSVGFISFLTGCAAVTIAT